jgi:hypothetical protein
VAPANEVYERGPVAREASDGSMLDGVMLLWFLLAAAALLFVAVDIRSTPEISGPQNGASRC